MLATLLNQNALVFDALSSAGRDAAEIAGLFWVMVSGAVVIWLIVTAFALHASRSRRPQWSERAGLLLIAIGGAAVPAVVLAALLAYGMPALARQLEGGAGGTFRVTVVGEQWWWRVRYEAPGGAARSNSPTSFACRATR